MTDPREWLYDHYWGRDNWELERGAAILDPKEAVKYVRSIASASARGYWGGSGSYETRADKIRFTPGGRGEQEVTITIYSFAKWSLERYRAARFATSDEAGKQEPTEKEEVVTTSKPRRQTKKAPAGVQAAIPGVKYIPLDHIDPNPWQPRQLFDIDVIKALAESIKTNGLSQYPRGRNVGGDRVQLAVGEQRFKAFSLLAEAEPEVWTGVPVVIAEMTDEEMAIAGLEENRQRRDLTPMEEARGFQRLVTEFGMTQDQLAERMNLHKSTVSHMMAVLRLPETVLARGEELRLAMATLRELTWLMNDDHTHEDVMLYLLAERAQRVQGPFTRELILDRIKQNFDAFYWSDADPYGVPGTWRPLTLSRERHARGESPTLDVDDFKEKHPTQVHHPSGCGEWTCNTQAWKTEVGRVEKAATSAKATGVERKSKSVVKMAQEAAKASPPEPEAVADPEPVAEEAPSVPDFTKQGWWFDCLACGIGAIDIDPAEVGAETIVSGPDESMEASSNRVNIERLRAHMVREHELDPKIFEGAVWQREMEAVDVDEGWCLTDVDVDQVLIEASLVTRFMRDETPAEPEPLDLMAILPVPVTGRTKGDQPQPDHADPRFLKEVGDFDLIEQQAHLVKVLEAVGEGADVEALTSSAKSRTQLNQALGSRAKVHASRAFPYDQYEAIDRISDDRMSNPMKTECKTQCTWGMTHQATYGGNSESICVNLKCFRNKVRRHTAARGKTGKEGHAADEALIEKTIDEVIERGGLALTKGELILLVMRVWGTQAHYDKSGFRGFRAELFKRLGVAERYGMNEVKAIIPKLQEMEAEQLQRLLLEEVFGFMRNQEPNKDWTPNLEVPVGLLQAE